MAQTNLMEGTARRVSRVMGTVVLGVVGVGELGRSPLLPLNSHRVVSVEHEMLVGEHHSTSAGE